MSHNSKLYAAVGTKRIDLHFKQKTIYSASETQSETTATSPTIDESCETSSDLYGVFSPHNAIFPYQRAPPPFPWKWKITLAWVGATMTMSDIENTWLVPWMRKFIRQARRCILASSSFDVYGLYLLKKSCIEHIFVICLLNDQPDAVIVLEVGFESEINLDWIQWREFQRFCQEKNASEVLS